MFMIGTRDGCLSLPPSRDPLDGLSLERGFMVIWVGPIGDGMIRVLGAMIDDVLVVDRYCDARYVSSGVSFLVDFAANFTKLFR